MAQRVEVEGSLSVASQAHAVGVDAAAAAAASEARPAIDTLAARVELLSTSGATPASSDPERTVARIGNVRWDADTATVSLAAHSEAGVDRSSHRPVAAIVNRQGVGSAIETAFCMAEALQRARIAVSASHARREWEGATDARASWRVRREHVAQTPQWTSVAVNMSCSLWTDAAVEGYLALVAEDYPGVVAVHVTELDGLLTTQREAEVDGWKVW